MADSHYIMEQWRVIYDAPDYAISDHGRVMRIAAERMAWLCNIVTQWDLDGYRGVSLRCGEPKKSKRFQVHRLVCKAFNGHPPTREHQVAHCNGVKDDNRASNLRWATAKENTADRVLHGTAPIGARNPRSKLLDADVHEIRRHKKTYGVGTMLARRYGVTETTISGILSGKTWKQLPWEDGSAPQRGTSKR